MIQFSTPPWLAKAKKRKAYRDHYREKFFKENGVTKGADALTFSGAPTSQRKRVIKLMKITKGGNALSSDQEEMLAQMASQIMVTGLGKGEMGTVSKTISSFDDFTYAKLKSFFF